jgi:choice-of-anchor C domain-containing protein
MKKFLFAVIIAAVGSGTAMADVVNGSFESGTPNDGATTHWTRLAPGDASLAGWTVDSGNVDWWSAQVAPGCAGSRSLELNGNTNGHVRQTLATKPGVAYRVTFCLAGNPNGPPAVKTLRVEAGPDQQSEYEFDTNGRTLTDMGWSTRSFTFTATDTSTTLRFVSATNRDDGGLNAFGPVIDNVVVAEDRATRTLTDQWYIEAESGWGAAVLQQGNTLFIDLFVYGADGKPTWFVAAATYQSGAPTGHVVFTGDVYTATGPYYGAAFNSAPVLGRKVGTLTFDSDTVETATLTYSVDGTNVVKNVTRQTWRLENIAGSYYGGFVWDQACGPGGTERDHMEFFGSLQSTHSADNVVTIVWQITSVTENGVAQPVPANASISLTGPYTQSGHMGKVQGTLNFAFGDEVGTLPWNLFEIERTINGIVGRFTSDSPYSDACHYDGRFGGVRR